MTWVSRFRIRLASRHLRQGGILAYPTEAVYGLGCDPFNRQAVEWIRQRKARSSAKSFILIAAEFEQIEPLLAPLSPDLKRTINAKWPGPVTWVVPAAPSVPKSLVAADQTIAVRVSAHPLVASLCREYGRALISTSANPGGRIPAKTAVKVRRYFAKDPIRILAGPIGKDRKPTPIYDLLTGNRLR